MIPAVVEKRYQDGTFAFSYDGAVISRGADVTVFTGHFRVDVPKSYVHFRVGDRTVEYFYADRWYNILELHDVDDDRLKGWYCNVARPAQIVENPDGLAIIYEDLALDVFVYPDGRLLVLDEDEFAELNLEAQSARMAWRAVDLLREQAARRERPFDQIKAAP